ncbi:MAG: peptidoglycan binding protein CsiV [Candidatus Sedimenticola sp. 20ELBAFRAG]
MSLTRFLSTLLLGLLLGSQTVSAQESNSDETQRLYDIELVVFARNGADAGSSETWPEDAGSPDMSSAVVLGRKSASTSPGATLIEYLPKNTHRLSAEKNRLKRKGGQYTPLVHLAWRQPGFPRKLALPIYLRSPQATDFDQPLLEGTATISLGRFLHADLDLLLRPKYNVINNSDPLASAIPGHRFQSHRKMRSGELHYLDHPKLGVLIQIEKYEAPEPEPVMEEVPLEAPVPIPTTAAPQSPAPAAAPAQ